MFFFVETRKNVIYSKLVNNPFKVCDCLRKFAVCMKVRNPSIYHPCVYTSNPLPLQRNIFSPAKISPKQIAKDSSAFLHNMELFNFQPKFVITK